MAWVEKNSSRKTFIQPGNPLQNAYVQRDKRTKHFDWLAQYFFDSVEHVQEFTTQWLWTYNCDRPNTGIIGITPKQKLTLGA